MVAGYERRKLVLTVEHVLSGGSPTEEITKVIAGIRQQLRERWKSDDNVQVRGEDGNVVIFYALEIDPMELPPGLLLDAPVVIGRP